MAERHTRGDGDYRRLVAPGEARTGMPERRPYVRDDGSAREAEIAAQLAAIRLEARRRRSAALRAGIKPEDDTNDN